jgi:hypothetical protein
MQARINAFLPAPAHTRHGIKPGVDLPLEMIDVRRAWPSLARHCEQDREGQLQRDTLSGGRDDGLAAPMR